MSEQSTENIDALADILKTIRLNANIYFCNDYQAPWQMEVPKGPNGQFHAVVDGACYIKIGNGEPTLLNSGDIVAFPTGGAHWMSDSITVENEPEYAAEKTRLLCGTFTYDHNVHHPFLKDLPCFIRVNTRESEQHLWLSQMIRVLADESLSPSPGSGIMVDRLTEILFIQLMRAYMQQNAKNMSYFTALADPQIGKALNLIHSDHKAHWSVERLGDAVAMSRTSFTDKFVKLVGEAPKTYIINVRMQKAKEKLIAGKESMVNIAEAAGYSSESAFSKAFKRMFELTPGSLRRSRS